MTGIVRVFMVKNRQISVKVDENEIKKFFSILERYTDSPSERCKIVVMEELCLKGMRNYGSC